MKTIILLITLLFISATTLQAQEKWRTLTFNANAGTELFDADNTFIGGSVGLHWDFNDRYFLSNWNGVHYSLDVPFSDWFVSQVTINRKIRVLGISVGGGIQYRNDLNNLEATFGVIQITKTFRLK